jgi:hypothetical protein
MNNKINISLFALLSILLQACAPTSYVVQEPEPSTIVYSGQNTSPTNLTFTDKRQEDSKVFSHGVLKAELIINGSPIDPIEFLKNNTARELSARGVPTNLVDSGDITIDINKLEMRNHRTNGYTPFISLTMLSADVSVSGQKERMTAFIKRGKVPVWSFDEIIQPTLNEPLDLLVKEFSSKLSSKLYNKKISDAEVQMLIEKIDANLSNGATYLDVYQLGFGNNSSAIPALVNYTKSDSEYIRLAAISSLGILKAKDQIVLLKGIYKDAGTWSDRAMAIKAIGDIGTADALAFLEEAREELNNKKGKEKAWTKEIISLYI